MSCRANNAHLSSTIDTLQVESKLLKRRNELLQEDVEQAKRTGQEARDEVVALRKDKQDLVEQLAVVEKKTTDLSKQVCGIISSRRTEVVNSITRLMLSESRRWLLRNRLTNARLEIVSAAFGKTSFVEESFVPIRVVFNDSAQIMSALPSVCV